MAKAFPSFFAWRDDLASRKAALAAFADFSDSEIQGDSFTWGDGLYLILHFDLITRTPDNNELARNATYDAIESVVRDSHGTRLGGSVYIVPLLQGVPSETCAIQFWNTLSNRFENNLLVQGDSFFLHYAPDIRNLMGGISVIVGKDRSLTRIGAAGA